MQPEAPPVSRDLSYLEKQVLDVLAVVFARQQRWPGPREVATVIGKNAGSVLRCMRNLEKTGHLTRGPKGDRLLVRLSDGTPVRLGWIPVDVAPGDRAG